FLSTRTTKAISLSAKDELHLNGAVVEVYKKRFFVNHATLSHSKRNEESAMQCVGRSITPFGVTTMCMARARR
ncbi:MAG: hypothetical protein MUD01_04020, partial [Chloroflexaceae bacterium]|nr:hypothetical protein [Chloroflexaceae bacterium]